MTISDALNYFSNGYLFPEPPYTSSETLTKDISKYSECKTLLEEAKKVIQEYKFPPLDLRLEPTTGGFLGEQSYNIIRIQPNLSASHQRCLAVFELVNLTQQKKFYEVWGAMANGGYKSAEEFARALEFIEYNTSLRTKVITRSINEKNGRMFRPYMKNSFEKYPIESMGFDIYYYLIVPETHKEAYRKVWRRFNKTSNLGKCLETASNIVYVCSWLFVGALIGSELNKVLFKST